MRRLFAIAATLLLGTGIGCMVSLDHTVSCGDGYVDSLAGEQCEPDVPSSYEDGCAAIGRAGGVADCDPESCTIIANSVQCGFCGDGIVDRDLGETCDGANLDGKFCPGGGMIGCDDDCQLNYTGCERCGDGVVDEDEECDPKFASPMDIVEELACDMLESPYSPTVEYGSGFSSQCSDDCRWDRSKCSYCGNGRQDDPTPLNFTGGLTSLPEVCDGEDAKVADLEAHCRDECGAAGTERLRCSFECAEDCREFILSEQEPAAIGCCLKKGEKCPGANDPFPCCWALDNPESLELACNGDIVDGEPGENARCR